MSGRAAGVSHEYRSTRDTVPREETTTSRSHLILPEDPVSVPRARLSGLSPGTARPLSQGAGGGRGSGREVGVVYEYCSTRDTRDRGGSGQS